MSYSQLLHHVILRAQALELLAHADHVRPLAAQAALDLLEAVEHLVALVERAAVARLELLDARLLRVLGVLELLVPVQHVVRQLEHLHLILLVDARLHVHDQLALQAAVLLLRQAAQLLHLGQQCCVLAAADELLRRLQQHLVHVELRLVLE